MKYSWLLLVLGACAQATVPSRNEELGAELSDAGGGGASAGSLHAKAGAGGNASAQAGTGGRASGGAGTASAAGSGNIAPLGGVGPGGCTLGEEASCTDVHPQYPKGTTTCERDGFPTTTCHVCETGDTIACGEIAGNTGAPYGEASCDPLADFGKGDWLLDECEICEAGVTQISCLEIEGMYTGGQAVCNATGDGWLPDSCAVCGDGAQNGELEQCDGSDVTATTCGELDFGGTDPATPVTACAANCNFDTSLCGHCAGGVGAGDCLESGSCTGAGCDAKGCARDASCQFLCRDNAANKCHYPVCSERATCRFDCYNQGGCLQPECRAGASCQFACQNQGGECQDIVCEDGAQCDFTCSDGGTCTTAEPVRCKAGDDCSVSCTNGGNCGDFAMVCEPGSICHLHMSNAASVAQVECQAGATCHLHCAGADCSSITCTGSGCKCGTGPCPGFP